MLVIIGEQFFDLQQVVGGAGSSTDLWCLLCVCCHQDRQPGPDQTQTRTRVQFSRISGLLSLLSVHSASSMKAWQTQTSAGKRNDQKGQTEEVRKGDSAGSRADRSRPSWRPIWDSLNRLSSSSVQSPESSRNKWDHDVEQRRLSGTKQISMSPLDSKPRNSAWTATERLFMSFKAEKLF